MPRIDPLVRHLFEFGADALGIGAGHQVVLLSGDERRPITANPLQEGQVEDILREIVPAEHASQVTQPGEHAFGYAAPSGPVTVRVQRGDGLRMIVSPAVDPAPAPVPENGAPAGAGAGLELDSPAAAPAPVAVPTPGASPTPSVPAAPPKRAAPPVGAPVRADIPAPVPGQCALDPLLHKLVQAGGSDLYICTGKPPLMRKDGDLVTMGENERLTAEGAEDLLFSICEMEDRQTFEQSNDVDFAYEIPGTARFRGNLFRDRYGISGIFRVIPSRILSAEELNLPRAVLELCMLNKGLVLVTGPTGSGKSTTLAAMVDFINRHRPAHMITIEDPIEFVHEDKRCVINQREVGTHTQSFKRALKAALREDPDIVLVGEMRDLETIETAIETAETGHLVLGTLHTSTAASTVDRIIDQFPVDRQSQIRTMLSEGLKGVVAQNLCKRLGGGRVAALEILLVTSSVSNIIREGKTFQLPSIMQTGRSLGMVTLNEALIDLVKNGAVDPREAYAKAADKNDLKNQLQRNKIDLGD